MMKKSISILISIFIFSVVFITAQITKNSPQENYIKKYRKIAIEEMYRSGVPASITLAQGLLESRAGQSSLAVKANNHFGIKCHDWKGPSMRFDDDAKGECFRKYKNPVSSFEDHSDFLRYRDRYKFLFDFEITDYKSWCYGLKKAGYATDVSYATKLITIIEKYDLARYDKGRGSYSDDDNDLYADGDRRSKKSELPDAPNKLEQAHKLEGREVFKFSLSVPLYSINKTIFIYSIEGDSYESIAKRYHLFNREILSFNDLEKTETLYPGTVVYLERKRIKTVMNIDKHIANGEESLRDIAQRYGVRLNSLVKRNSLKNTIQGKSPQDFIPRENYTIKLR